MSLVSIADLPSCALGQIGANTFNSNSALLVQVQALVAQALSLPPTIALVAMPTATTNPAVIAVATQRQITAGNPSLMQWYGPNGTGINNPTSQNSLDSDAATLHGIIATLSTAIASAGYQPLQIVPVVGSNSFQSVSNLLAQVQNLISEAQQISGAQVAAALATQQITSCNPSLGAWYGQGGTGQNNPTAQSNFDHDATTLNGIAQTLTYAINQASAYPPGYSPITMLAWGVGGIALLGLIACVATRNKQPAPTAWNKSKKR